MNGVSDTEFAPNKEITRGEIATLIVRAFEKTVSFAGTSKEFSDVNGYWGKSYAEAASQAGIVTGDVNGSTFRPNDKSTRAEAMVMLQRALHKENTDLPDGSWKIYGGKLQPTLAAPSGGQSTQP